MKTTTLKSLSLLALISLLGVAPSQAAGTAARMSFSLGATDSNDQRAIFGLDDELDEAEKKATPEGRAVLETARVMIANDEIVIGSCWDYVNAIYNKAGFEINKRSTLYNSRFAGPYADLAAIEAGDWLYFVNHSFGDVEHSAIFVSWVDFESKEALMISYAGGDKAIPARYKTYDLSSVYNVMRPKPYLPGYVPSIKPSESSPRIENRRERPAAEKPKVEEDPNVTVYIE